MDRRTNAYKYHVRKKSVLRASWTQTRTRKLMDRRTDTYKYHLAARSPIMVLETMDTN